jgi:hypothetical protein
MKAKTSAGLCIRAAGGGPERAGTGWDVSTAGYGAIASVRLASGRLRSEVNCLMNRPGICRGLGTKEDGRSPKCPALQRNPSHDCCFPPV